MKINYSSSIKNNFDEINYENLSAKIKINNLETSFDINQNDLNIFITYLIQLVLYLFKTRRKINLTEYYTLSYQYENDCLSASVI